MLYTIYTDLYYINTSQYVVYYNNVSKLYIDLLINIYRQYMQGVVK